MSRDVRLIVGAVGISALGDFLLWVPLTLHLEATTGSGLAVAGLMIALFAPIVVLAPIAGLVVDRRDAREVLIVSSLAQALIAAALALALDSTAAIIALAALLGTGFALAQPAEFALVPTIAGERSSAQLNRINGYVETSRYIGMTAGPLLGGALAATGGTQVAVMVNAATFVGVALAAFALRARRAPVSMAAEGPGGAQDRRPDRARDGFKYLFGDRVLVIVVGAAFVSLLFMSATITAEVFYLKQDLAVGDTLYGLLFSAWTVGMVVGAIAISRRVKGGALAVGALIAIGVQGLGVGAPAAVLAVGFAGAMWFVGGLGHGTKNVLVRTLIQERVPERLHGRAFAAYNGVRNGAELFAIAAGGVLVAAIGARTTLAIAGAMPVLTALVGLAVYRRRAAGGSSGPTAEPEEPEPLIEPAPAGGALVE
ncbi:MAG: MFS transporter [Solirubrobacterales bacterium]|nr:MFS transporter [Solirubrobacterales bacterium]